MAEWFQEWFGEEYLRLYPHRDDADAERAVALIVETIPVGRDWRVLDVACGAGRHARAFRARGISIIGVDLSMHLLQRARETARIPVARADMRDLPIRPRSMDLAVNLFTSFGYFERDFDHLRALREMLGTLRPGGWFVLDYLNATMVKRGLVAREETRLADREFTVERWLHDGDRFVVKTITAPGGRQFMERVRLYGQDELVGMVTAAGGRVRRKLGSYAGDPPSDDAPRAILFAQTA